MKRFLVLMALVLAALVSTSAFAITSGGDGNGTVTPISTTINLDTLFAGATPDGPSPWLTATFASQVGSTTGTLTLTSNLINWNFVQGLNSSIAPIGWAFFLDQTVTGFTCVSGQCADNGAGFNAAGYNSGAVPGIFNVAFGWSSSNRFMGGSSAVYDLTFGSALTGNPFALNQDQWMSVAHVQGINSTCSGWIVSGSGGVQGATPCLTTVTTVPEPAELGMLGLGLLLMGLLVGLRKRRG